MKLTLYGDDSQTIKEYPILSEGKPGSSWETPTGEYKVNFKHKEHFSSIGYVWMPWSIQFYGNFFIHGWSYYSGGAPVPEGYSRGCVRLSTEDAKEVFKFAESDMTIFVYDAEGKFFSYRPPVKLANIKPPKDISASSFFAADLESGDIFLEQKAEAKLPIASLTKLMTAVVASEAIFYERAITINQSIIQTYGDSGNLKIGETLSFNDLLYPLLMESSNDAAKTISVMSYGEKTFVDLINKKASALGMKNSSFADALGVSSENV